MADKTVFVYGAMTHDIYLYDKFQYFLYTVKHGLKKWAWHQHQHALSIRHTCILYYDAMPLVMG